MGFALAVTIAAIFNFSIPAALFFTALAGLINSYVIYNFVFFHYYRLQERKADEMSVTKLNGAGEGGIYFFNNVRSFQKGIRDNASDLKDKILTHLIFSPSGNNRISRFSHFTETDRIKHIQKIIKNMENVKTRSHFNTSKFSFSHS